MATTFIAEAYASSAAAAADLEARARLAAEELSGSGADVRYLRAIFVPEDETCFHLFAAASADEVRRASQRAGLRAHRIVAAAELGTSSAT